MLTLEQYGVKLTRLTADDIELVRHWRNRNEVANYMEYRNQITPEEQVKWFKSVNNKYNYYFIIEFEEKKIGLINAKNYNPKEGFGEGGIFIWDKDYINSFAAVFATLCLLNFSFFALNLTKSKARVLRTNDRAVHYNKLIGYKLLPGQDDVENQLYELTFEDYKVNATKLNNAAVALCEGKGNPVYSGAVCDENMDEINNLLLQNKTK
ncbi:MAG TPA: GNAT family N-acetyltransferase [Bacteroidia bacterium]|jgi:UDP-4-amino-4,6-dideoxy-N-acetyl-beta-L-altrosamine N-acetyltransferase|nr:GNAT family N-acetyltransferase [Bacteroidia bacterium]